MRLEITTRYRSNPTTGAGGILAKGGGKQYRLPYVFSLTSYGNHLLAAERLAEKILGVKVWEEDLEMSDPEKGNHKIIRVNLSFVELCQREKVS